MAPRTAVIPPELEGPLDRALRVLLGSSWGRARAWIQAGKVRVGGTVVTEPTSRVRAGAEIVLDERAPRPRPAELADEDVVYIDAQVVVIAKPPGVSTVPFDDTDKDTLEGRVRHWLERRRLAPGGARPTLGIVHRLDKETSGLVVFTRTWMAKQSLSAQFRRHLVRRRYLAVAHGDVAARTFRSWLMEDRGDGLRGSMRGATRGTLPAGAREAITHVEPIERLAGATWLACRLETGRTHQIRIHLSEVGHPLLGERVYVRGFAGPPVAAPRLMLHAVELAFVHPTTEREMQWELPVPRDMESVVARLRVGRPGLEGTGRTPTRRQRLGS